MMLAVAFDLWETLITDSREAAHRQERLRLDGILRAMRAAGVEPRAEDLEAAYSHTWTRCFELYWSRDRDIPSRVQVTHMLEHLFPEGDSLDQTVLDAIEHAYVSPAIDHLPRLVDGAAELLASLGGRFSLGLISNTGRTPGSVLREVLRRLGVADAFTVMVFSNEHGDCKPLPSIFEKLRAGLGVPAEQIVFVGDNLYADVWGAQQAGMRAVHFDPPARGCAIGPPIRDIGPVRPHATIRSLRDLSPILEDWARGLQIGASDR